MPQLNPAPWLMILVISWLTLLTMFSSKTILTLPQNSPSTEHKTANITAPWNWPWT